MATSSPLRISPTLVALTALALTPFITAPDLHAQAAKPAAKAAAKPAAKETLEDILTDAESKFFSGKYPDAIARYKQAEDMFGKKMNADQLGAIAIRVASCHFQAKKWKDAETSFLNFLDETKFPNGAGGILDPIDNFRGKAQLSLAFAQTQLKKYDEALTGLAAFDVNVKNPEADRIKARTFRAEVLQMRAATGTPADKKQALQRAAELLSQTLRSAPISRPEVKEAGYKLVQIYGKLGKVKEAEQLRQELEAKITNPVELVRSNFLKMELGDRYFQDAEELLSSSSDEDSARREALYKQAIDAYQGVHSRAYISGFMDKALAMAEKRVEQAKTMPMVKNPEKPDEPAKPEGLLKAESDFEAIKKIHEDFAKNKDYDSLLAYRLGLCLTELHRPWEALIALKEIIDKNPEFESIDIAYYHYINALNNVHRYKAAQDECKKFIAKYPKSRVLGDVAMLLGDISMGQEEYRDAVTNFRWALDNVPTLTKENKEYIGFAISDAYFRNVDWKDARKSTEEFLRNHPNSNVKMRELVSYMNALTFFYEGMYKETKTAFDNYLRNYPTGEYKPDVLYRTALVILGTRPENDADAKRKAEEVISRCDRWVEAYKDTTSPQVLNQTPEVMTLKGDAYQKIADLKSLTPAEKKKYSDLVVDCYVAASKKAANNKQTLDFLLRELNKSLPARGEWDRLRDIYQGLYDRDRKSPEALGHLYWIIKCTERLGKNPEERLKNAEEAKNILSGAIVENINDPRQDQVESLIIELAGKLAREVKKREKINKDKPGTVEAFDAEAAIVSMLNLNENKDSLIAQARGSFTRAELARAMKNEKEVVNQFDLIAKRFKPEDLSPTILALVGDHLARQGRLNEALPFFKFLKERFRSSMFADYGFAGVAESLLSAKKYKEALSVLDDAIENEIIFSKEKDIRFMHARIQMEAGQYKEAKAAFEAIASNKQWRGETTAGCLYLLGQIEERKGNYKDAVNYYNRCYLSWKKYETYACKAVLGAALLYADKLNQRTAAVETLNTQMLKVDNAALLARYKQTPEWRDAEKLLERLK